ncbi:sensor histidine kinase [Halalkalibacter oceani]|uniref:histidine kinase n=1 Tax=Halalkalibacter oceani TaxID=1653776 RepID=A0A9X2DUJ5_9BACI|nr:ATP-binding protein [Halalkalibacter oceani]MCM3716340.1 ATP-binding protein [Halalkalibacter oceani]
MTRLSIKTKVWATVFAVALFFLGAGVMLTFYLYERLYLDKQIELFVRQGEELAETYQTSGNSEAFAERIDWVTESTAADILFTADPMLLGGGSPFDPYSNETLITFEERQQLLNGETVVMIRPHPRFQQDILGVAIPLFHDGHLAGSIFLTNPLSEVHEPFLAIRDTLVIGMLVFFLLILFLGRRITNAFVAPLLEMKQIAGRMAGGDFSQRIAIEARKDELGQLAQSFNTLSTSLEEVEMKRREFLANVSHELRTPLSYMKGYAEAVEESVIEPKKGLTIIQNEANRLERLVNDLLDLAQLEGESYPMKLEPIAFAQLINDVVEAFEVISEQRSVTIKRQLDEDCIISGDSDRLEQVVRNLLDNALRYSPPHETIDVTLAVRGASAELTISDNGPGIPKQDVPHVTERFYRVNKARTRKDGGTGLGLAIVAQIVKKHRGELEFVSGEGAGTIVRLVLPLEM